MRSKKKRLRTATAAMEEVRMAKRATEIFSCARKGLPRWLSFLVCRKIDRIMVTVDATTICRAARLVQSALAFWAQWTNTDIDDRASQILNRILEDVCPST